MKNSASPLRPAWPRHMSRAPSRQAQLRLLLVLPAVALACASCARITGVQPTPATVFVASDRQKLALNQPLALLFGVERGADLTYKACTLTLPQVEHPGGADPGLLLEPGRSATKLEPGAEIAAAELVERLGAVASETRLGAPAGRPEVLIFVHGFAVEPCEAVLQAGQFVHDVDFAGPVIVFNWPTRGLYLSYLVDGLNAEWSIPDFVRLLELVYAARPTPRIHIVAHSMGTRIVMRGVREFLARRGVPGSESAEIPAIEPPPGGEKWFGQIVFVASDEDTEIFERSFAGILAQAAARTTIYHSNRDRALDLSGWLFGYARLGAAPGPRLRPELGERIQSIDATHVDRGFFGHSYHVDSPEVLRDIREVFAGHPATEPQRRLDHRTGLQLIPE